MKKAGLLNASTDVADLAKRSFVALEGVTDEWLKTITVEKVAGGGPVGPMTGDQMASILAVGGHKSCCINPAGQE
jgi:NitT/TauT family transport system substrate-binding protein